MPRILSFAILLPLLLSRPLHGQKTPDRPPIDLTPPAPDEPRSKSDPLSGSILAGWGVPVGAFHRNEDGGGGLDFQGAYAFDRARHFSLRVEGGFLAYGYVSGDVNVPQYDEFGIYQGNADVSYAVREHQMYSLGFGPEVTAVNGRIRPYAFATVGLSYFRSSMNVRPPAYDGDSGDDETIFSADNFAWSTGIGLRIGPRNARAGAFDIGVRFRRNARAHYVNDRSLSDYSNGAVTVTPFYGSANVIMVYVGAWIGPKGRV
ncbi:MAG TPA: hypothetical protein VJN70_08315 [Gemmatimonadaceae bacterium]|nr:hypothetical protein [Gemmatimonadaceae bacterium]